MQRFTDEPSRLDAALTSAWKEVREVAWLAAVVAALSVGGIVIAISLSFALDRHFGAAGHHAVKTAHCPTSTHR
jgi:orotate phosphoribosyltransferase